MIKQVINTPQAPQAIGAYSQAIKIGNAVYFSGQIPLDPKTMQIVAGDFKDQVRQVIANLSAVAQAAGGDLANIVKLNIYLIDMEDFAKVNEIMEELWPRPYPARAVVGVKALPKNASIEADAVMQLAL